MEPLFKEKNEIKDLIERAVDYGETEKLIKKFRRLKNERKEFYLSLEELEEILKWKLRLQYGRQSKYRELNTEDNVIKVTRTAFSISHPNEEYETKLKLRILTSLSGVEIPVASAILTLCFPEKYSVIDFRNWNQVYKSKKGKTNYTINQYVEYLNFIRKIAKQYNLTPQEIDLAIWQKDIEENKKPNKL